MRMLPNLPLELGSAEPVFEIFFNLATMPYDCLSALEFQ